MPSFEDAWARARPYWGVIERAAQLGMNTQDLWSAIRDAADELGLSSPGVRVQDISVLRGVAGGIVATGQAFQDAPPNRVITGRLISEAPWARPAGQRKVFPEFHYRFEHTVLSDGIEVTVPRTIRFQGRLPRTIGELLAAAEEDAGHLAEEYGQTHVSAGPGQLFEV